MHWFPAVASLWAEKLHTDIDFAPLMPGKDKNFGVSLVLDFRTWWRHMQAKNNVIKQRFVASFYHQIDFNHYFLATCCRYFFFIFGVIPVN